MLSPEETANYDPFITIPTSLAIDYEKTGERAGISSELKDMLGFLSNDSYERHHLFLYIFYFFSCCILPFLFISHSIIWFHKKRKIINIQNIL